MYFKSPIMYFDNFEGLETLEEVIHQSSISHDRKMMHLLMLSSIFTTDLGFPRMNISKFWSDVPNFFHNCIVENRNFPPALCLYLLNSYCKASVYLMDTIRVPEIANSLLSFVREFPIFFWADILDHIIFSSSGSYIESKIIFKHVFNEPELIKQKISNQVKYLEKIGLLKYVIFSMSGTTRLGHADYMAWSCIAFFEVIDLDPKSELAIRITNLLVPEEDARYFDPSTVSK
jgi:hypothetical protein